MAGQIFLNVMFGLTKQSLEDPDTCASLSNLPIDKVLLVTDSLYLDSPDPFSILDIAQSVCLFGS